MWEKSEAMQQIVKFLISDKMVTNFDYFKRDSANS